MQRRPQVESLEDRTLLSGWVVSAVGNLDDPGNDVAVDSAGNVYLTGNFAGTRDFDPGPGVYNLTSVGTEDQFVAKYTSDGSLLWAQRAGSNPAPNILGSGSWLALDSAGNIYLTGTFQGTIDVGTTTLSSAGQWDIYVAKLDSTGTFLWAIGAGGTGRDNSSSIAAHESGFLSIVGYFTESADFDPSPSATYSLTSAGGADAFVWKLDADGNFVSALAAGSTGMDSALDVAVDGLGSVHVVGSFSATVDFDPGPGTNNLSSTGDSDNDLYVWKLDSSSDLMWARAVGAPEGIDRATGVAVDVGGNVYVTGQFFGNADFDPGPGTTLFSSTSCVGKRSSDGYVLKLDATGNFLWARQLAGLGEENFQQYFGNPLALDADGNVYVVGSYNSPAVDFDDGPATILFSNRESRDGYVWKLDGATGGFVWARTLGGPSEDSARGIAVDSNGNVFVTGLFSGTATFDVGMSDISLTSTAAYDLFLARIDQDGGAILGRVFNDSNNNGVEDTGEVGLANWSVYLDQNDNGALDSGESVVTTGTFGEFQLRHLAAGTYTVRQVVQSGWTQTLPSGGSAFNVTLGNGEFAVRSFGNFNPAESPAGWISDEGGCKDLETGLVWSAAKNDYSRKFWFGVQETLDLSQHGFSDWRVPTIREMQIAFAHGGRTLGLGSISGFAETWSMTLTGRQSGTGVNKQATAWQFNFDTGMTREATIGGNSGLLMVRSGGASYFSDDGANGYSDTGGWTIVTGSGQEADYRYYAKGNGSAKASWSFSGLPAGAYQVQTTWVPLSSNASNAPYKIFTGTTLLNTVSVNQQKAPATSTYNNMTIPWQTLGTFTISGNTLKVELNNNARGNVVGDMVRLIPVTPTVPVVSAITATRKANVNTVDAAIRSFYNDNRDSRQDLLEEIAATRDVLRRLRSHTRNPFR
jgi:hypothetical protein